MAQRLKEITYLRAFAALSIVLIHATSGYINNLPGGAAINQLPRFGSPLFVIMSGFILYHIELIRPSSSYWHFFRHRFLKVAIPYLIWTIFYSTYTMRGHIFGPYDFDVASTLQTYFVDITTGTGYVHLYFVLIMIQLYALFPFLRQSMEKSTYSTIVIVSFVSFTFQLLIYLHRIHVITLPSLIIPYATLCFGWLVFFCLGIFLRMRLAEIMGFWQKRRLLIALTWLFFLVAVVIDEGISHVNISLRPAVSLYGIATFFLFYLIFEGVKDKVPKMVDQVIEWVAGNSFHIYLVHPIMLNRLVMLSPWQGYSGMVALYISAVILTCLFIYLLTIFKSLWKKPARLVKELRVKEV